jgi:hypothetical protein
VAEIPPWLWWSLAGVAIVLVGGVLLVWRKGRPFGPGDVFRASRLSGGNRIFPTQVLISTSSVVQHTARWIGHEEKSIHMAHIASVEIKTGLLFSDVLIETTGGEHPIVCHGHRKQDAVRMKTLIERHQTVYYRTAASSPGTPGPTPAPAPPPTSRGPDRL